jgi:hypothetical protein
MPDEKRPEAEYGPRRLRDGRLADSWYSGVNDRRWLEAFEREPERRLRQLWNAIKTGLGIR